MEEIEKELNLMNEILSRLAKNPKKCPKPELEKKEELYQKLR